MAMKILLEKEILKKEIETETHFLKNGIFLSNVICIIIFLNYSLQ